MKLYSRILRIVVIDKSGRCRQPRLSTLVGPKFLISTKETKKEFVAEPHQGRGMTYPSSKGPSQLKGAKPGSKYYG